MDPIASYRILKLLEEEPQLTQRELAERLDVSVGKANYCLKALMEKGFVKARNFKNSASKLQYVYKITPDGLKEKTRVTIEFLRLKADEFDEIRSEIDRLSAASPEKRKTS